MRRSPPRRPRPPSPPWSRPASRHPRRAACPGRAPPAAHDASPQQADFDSWMVKTYLGCWKPAPQARRRRRLRRPGAARLQAGRIAQEAAEARQSAVRSGAEAPGEERPAGRARPATRCRFRPNIAPFMSNGRPRPSTSILRSPPDDAGRRSVLLVAASPPYDLFFACLSLFGSRGAAAGRRSRPAPAPARRRDRRRLRPRRREFQTRDRSR